MSTATVSAGPFSVVERLWISTAARIVLAGVFLAAGVPKLLHGTQSLDESARSVNAYEIFSTDIGRVIGYALPPVEVVLGILLLLGLFSRLCAWISAVLLTVFIVGIISVWVRGLSIQCGCFNSGGALAGAPPYHEYAREIIRDLALILVSMWLIKFPASKFSLDGWLQPSIPTTFDDDDVIDEAEEIH